MIERILNGDYLRIMDNIKQWQERDVAVKEDISSHSYKVAVFARVLSEDLLNGKNSDSVKLSIVTNAIFHDWDEVLIGRDLSHNLKYDPEVGERLRGVLSEFVSSKCAKEFCENGSNSEAMMISNINAWVEPFVKRFVKCCDWMAMKYYLSREISMGNRTLYRECVYVRSGLIESLELLIEEFDNWERNSTNVSGVGVTLDKEKVMRFIETLKQEDRENEQREY